ncbi:MAG: TetR family transcriptional regulator [Deltaproteobacteria bacterium]|nr:TetR family transcriptional regulator [Deltaproteobacteria bacterium]
MVARKRPMRKKQDLREAITLKAGELFGREGYHGVTVEQISKALGISKPSIYYHFASKEEILFEFHRFAHTRARDGLKEIAEGDMSPEKKLRAAIEFHIDLLSFEVFPGMVDLHWQFSLPKKFSKPIIKLRKEFDRHLRQIISEGIEKDVFISHDPKVVAFTIAGAINFLPQWYSSKGPLSQEEIKKTMADYLIKGIFKKG